MSRRRVLRSDTSYDSDDSDSSDDVKALIQLLRKVIEYSDYSTDESSDESTDESSDEQPVKNR